MRLFIYIAYICKVKFATVETIILLPCIWTHEDQISRNPVLLSIIHFILSRIKICMPVRKKNVHYTSIRPAYS